MDGTKHLGLKVSKELYDKFAYISRSEGKNISQGVVDLMKEYVGEFEQEHGEITEQSKL